VALKYPGGVLIAGDRRSTQGNMIAGRDVQKVYITDDYTATGIAGTAALAVEFARLYAVELEHYEKLEGVPMTFAGKVNRLAIMVRGNLGAALQGFVALPLLVRGVIDDLQDGFALADLFKQSALIVLLATLMAATGWLFLSKIGNAMVRTPGNSITSLMTWPRARARAMTLRASASE
jgi:hypothetical protein